MYLIIGGSGYLGRYMIKNILENTTDKVISTFWGEDKPALENSRLSWQELNICDKASVENLHKSVDDDVKIIYLAAYHHPDKVEENPQFAWDVNIVALANFVNIFHDAACFYYASTDTVYGEGDKGISFTEEAPLNPVNLYGKHKVLAEQITVAKGFNVVRYPFIIGASLVEGKNHFFDNIKNDLENGKTVDMFADSYRSTLDFNQCAYFLIRLIEKFGSCEEKTINIAGDDILSKYDVALLMAEKYGLDKNLIKPISVNECTTIFTAKRASTAVLDSQKLKGLLNLRQVKLEV